MSWEIFLGRSHPARGSLHKLCQVHCLGAEDPLDFEDGFPSLNSPWKDMVKTVQTPLCSSLSLCCISSLSTLGSLP